MIVTEFDTKEKMKGLVRVVNSMLGDRLGKLITPDGTVTTHPAVYHTHQQKLPEAQYPFIAITALPLDDNSGYKLDSGLITIEDPDTLEEVTVPYTSSHITYSVSMTCTGNGSQQILERIRGNMNFDRWKEAVNTEMESGFQILTSINYTPSLVDTDWVAGHTMLMKFTSISTTIDYQGTWWNVIEWNGKVYRNKDDSDPVVVPDKQTNTDFMFYNGSNTTDLNITVDNYLISSTNY